MRHHFATAPAFVTTAAAFATIVPASAGDAGARRSNCSGMTPGKIATAAASPRSILAIRSAGRTGATLLARLDALSLELRSRQLRIGEYHDTWSLSPDGKKLALGLSLPGARRVGIGVVDLASLRIVRKIATGIAAEAVAWLTPRRLAAGLQDGRLALVDPVSGEIVREARGSGEPRRSARVRGRLVVLFADVAVGGPVRIAVADARARIRSVTLDRIRLRARSGGGHPYADAAGLTVDPSGRRAYVAAAGAPLAVVALASMRVSYHRVPALTARAALERQRGAVWLGRGRFAVYGYDVTASRRIVPAGVTLVDSHGWSSCTLDARGSAATVAAGRLLVYGARGSPVPGMRVYTPRWRIARTLLQTAPVWDVKVAGRFAYIRTRSAVRVVDARSGRVLNTITRPPDLVDVIGG